ncbi:MAG: class II aldolase/adducin family protein [Candidatus Hodarchaeota archaeon]
MTFDSSQDPKTIVLNACKEMQKVALVIGSSGNASQRIMGTDQVAITPSSVDYSCMCADDVMIINLEGEVLDGDRNPSIEYPLHTAIYKTRPDVNAIVHTHCIYASALAVLRQPIPPIIDEFVIKLGGQVEVAEYGLPGSHELADNVVKALGPRNAVLLANHGGVTVGSTMDSAFHNALLLERVAQIYLLARAVDSKKITSIPPEAVKTQQQLFEMMKRFKKG